MIGYSALYAPFNEKSIFIEDEAGRLVHERIIKKIIGDGRVTRIFPLNGRDNVLAEWRKNRNDRRNIYVIDGDLGILYGTRLRSGNLYTLDAYCIENYLFNREVVSQVMEDYLKDHRSVDQCVDEAFSAVLGDADAFLNLYILYAVCHFRSCNETTVKEGGLRFLENYKVSRKRLRGRQRHLLGVIWARIGRERYLEEKRQIRALLKEASDPISFISGKSCLFPLLHKILEKRFGYVGGLELFVRQCSRYFRADHAPEFAEFLLSHFPRPAS